MIRSMWKCLIFDRIRKLDKKFSNWNYILPNSGSNPSSYSSLSKTQSLQSLYWLSWILCVCVFVRKCLYSKIFHSSNQKIIDWKQIREAKKNGCPDTLLLISIYFFSPPLLKPKNSRLRKEIHFDFGNFKKKKKQFVWWEKNLIKIITK